MNSATAIILTGLLVAVACALPGVFLVLRRMGMMADAISHAILPGLVLGYFLANGPSLLAGFLGAAVAAVVTVSLVEALQNSRRVSNDAAIGIVFPALFALGTLLVTRFFANVHLDADAILYGNIEFSSLDILVINGRDFGPQSIWVMGLLCVVNFLFVALLYKELKLATFDPALAATLGFSPVLLHYLTMTIVSVTAVGAFTAVGAVLAVALMIVPAAAAYLLTDRLPVMIGLSVLIGGLSAIGGYVLAVTIDSSIAGAMVTVAGALFGLVLLFSPSHGLLAKARRLGRNRVQFAAETLVVHLFSHENTAVQEVESTIAHLRGDMGWPVKLASQALGNAIRSGLIERTNGHMNLTQGGRALARRLAERDGQAISLN